MILDSPLKRFAIGVVLICWVVSSCTVVKNPITKSVSKDNSLVEAARAYMGVPYKLGGNDHKGIDCSGLICNSFKQIGIEIPRISWQQSDFYPTVRAEDIRKGDLVFFYTGGSFVNHVGIVTEVKSKNEVMFIHASSSKGVREDNLYTNYWWSRFSKATRVMK